MSDEPIYLDRLGELPPEYLPEDRFPCCGGLLVHAPECPTRIRFGDDRPAWHSIVDGIYP